MCPVLQFDQALNMQVATLLVFTKLDPNTRGLQHVDASEPCLRLNREHTGDGRAKEI